MGHIESFKDAIESHNKILFFTGAGVSTLSGIPDFRSANGLYNTSKYPYSPERMLSRSFFFSHPDKFYDFYRTVFDARKYEPNIVHQKMAELEAAGKSIGVITQNVDGLHTKAGSKKVVEYHGSVYRNSCRNHTNKCPDTFSADVVFDSTGIPRCPVCNAIIKPDITLYEEQPYGHTRAVSMIVDCDMMVVCGTSLNVYPAASFINYLGPDQTLVIINRDATDYDSKADICLHADLGEVFASL
jgi:NAD-dependent deacetylase